MATNPLIALSVKTPNIYGSFQQGRQNALAELAAEEQARRQDRLFNMREQQAQTSQQTAQLQQMAMRQRLGGQAIAGLAMELKPLIDAGDFAGAQQLADARFQEFGRQGLSFPDPAPLRQALASGNPEALAGLPDRMLDYARTLGYVEREPTAAAAPASVQEFEYFQSLTPEQQQQWLQQRQSGSSSSPYFTPLQTSTGLYRFNARSGEIEPLQGQQGGQLLPVAIDPNAQAAVAGAKEAAKVTSKAEAEAQVNLPQIIATAEQTIALLDKAISHPGRKISTGMSSVLPAIPGTDAADFRVLMDQIGGKAFLEAFESLKGGGQITEVEGRKATEAIARLSRAQSEEGFVAALNELRDIARNGMIRAQVKANQQQQPAAGVRFLGFE